MYNSNLAYFGAMEIVSSSLYPRYLPHRIPPHESVTLVGSVVSLDEHSRKLILQPDLDSSLTIDVRLPENFECAELRNVKFLEVRGTGENNGEITMREYCNFKDNFDLKTYNEVLKLSNDGAFRSLFGVRN